MHKRSLRLFVSGGGAPCTGCEQFTGTLSGIRDYDYHPNGSWYYTAVSGTHRGWLRGPLDTDFNLYLYLAAAAVTAAELT